ncbi:MAG TPA: HAD family hydrolase [Dehalococcoidia bacterium]|nr:HAD family hydrolase [Dehalococcoidia bacterium]
MRQLVFMIDVDNTILNNDGVKQDMEVRLRDILGADVAHRFWELYEIVRKETDVVDFMETLRRLREEHPEAADRVDAASEALTEWDFCPRLYPRAIETVLHLKRLGLATIVSDGDPVFQPSKIHQCGVTQAVDGRVFIFVHKEKYLPAVEAYFRAEHYVLIDDKPGILMRSKASLGDRLTTVHVLQGKYALDPKHAVDYKPDIVVQNFSDLLGYGKDDFLLRASAAAAAG